MKKIGVFFLLCCFFFFGRFSVTHFDSKVVQEIRNSENTNYVIAKRDFGYGNPSPVIMVFGYIDDMEVCAQLLDAIKHSEHFGYEEFRQRAYLCLPER